MSSKPSQGCERSAQVTPHSKQLQLYQDALLSLCHPLTTTTYRMSSSNPDPTASSPQDHPTRPWELLIFLDTAPERGTMVSSAFATKDEAKAQLAEVVCSTNSSEGSIYATLADDGISRELFSHGEKRRRRGFRNTGCSIRSLKRRKRWRWMKRSPSHCG